jgi:hypothetical protein
VLNRHCDVEVMRAALHPTDIRYTAIAALWRRLLGQLAERDLSTEGRLLTL